MCGENSCNVFPLLVMVLWVPIFAMLFRRAVLMLWHASMFLELRWAIGIIGASRWQPLVAALLLA
jgi:hypothetical protein